MKVNIIEESGYSGALLGMALSYYDHITPLEEWWTEEKIVKADKRAKLLAHKDGGHNKLLEHITVQLYIQATRGFWQEFDTYRAGVSKQSASTMHTLKNRIVGYDDFEVGTSKCMVSAFNKCLLSYKSPKSPYYNDITRLKENLPEGWLQERVITTNYKVLRHIYSQRHDHRYKHWRTFCEYLLNNLQHPYFIKENL